MAAPDLARRVQLWPDTTEYLPEATIAELAELSDIADREGRMAERSLELLRDAGYPGAPVPKDLMGKGAGILECAAVQYRLAQADPGVAIGLNMHLFSVGIMVEVWRRNHDETWMLLEAIASQNRLVASAFGEPKLGGSLLRSSCVGIRARGGYVVSGLKQPCSIAARCDLVSFQFEADTEAGRRLFIAMIPAGAKGICVKRSWDAMGMRSSESDTLILEDCFVPDELVFHDCEPGYDPDDLFAAGLIWFCVTTTAAYLGLVDRALSETSRTLRQSEVWHLAKPRASVPSYVGGLGDVYASAMSLECACVGLARRFEDRALPPRELLPYALAVKQQAVQLCPEMVAGAVELVGGRAYGRLSLMSRLWRDVQAIRFHPPTRVIARQVLGQYALGAPYRFELFEQFLETDSGDGQ